MQDFIIKNRGGCFKPPQSETSNPQTVLHARGFFFISPEKNGKHLNTPAFPCCIKLLPLCHKEPPLNYLRKSSFLIKS